MSCCWGLGSRRSTGVCSTAFRLKPNTAQARFVPNKKTNQKAPSPREFGRTRFAFSSSVTRIHEERGFGVRSKRCSNCFTHKFVEDWTQDEALKVKRQKPLTPSPQRREEIYVAILHCCFSSFSFSLGSIFRILGFPTFFFFLSSVGGRYLACLEYFRW